MQIKIAKHSGFCFGVRRAIEIAEKILSESNGRVFSWGEIIHNPMVVERFSKKGMKVITDLKAAEEGTILISSHGTSPEALEAIHKKNLKIVDATCPYVRSAQMIAKRLKKEGFDIFIVGDRLHPEVRGILGFAGKRGYIIENAQLDGMPKRRFSKVGILAQTTQTKENFLNIILKILEKTFFKEARLFDTICNDTKARQQSAKELLWRCDLIIVVGGKNSANTRRLWEICRADGREAFHIEGAGEIKREWLKDKKSVGIVSGASTPDESIQEVVTALKKNSHSKLRRPFGHP